MYSVGDRIFYGRTGACVVDGIKELDGVMYYSLRPLYRTYNITTPVDNESVFSRPMIDAAEAERMIGLMPSIPAQPYYNHNLNRLREHYREWIECGDCERLIALVKSLYAKKQEAEARNRKFGAVDDKFLKEVQDLLVGEFAAALGIDRADVRGYIDGKLGI